MGKKYYFAARPETLVSVVMVGRLRDNLPDFIAAKNMCFYPTASQAAAKTTTTLHQTFLVEIAPNPVADGLLTEQHDRANNSTVITSNQIDTTWITQIFTYSQQGYNLAKRLLNGTAPVDITINPNIYTKLSKNKQKIEVARSLNPGFFNARQLTNEKSVITYRRQGDLLGSNMQTLINTVNTVGVMGKGIALAFKTQYPEMFRDYVTRCNNGEVKTGKPYMYQVSPSRKIINFPTKQHWRQPSEMSYISDGLIYLANHIQDWGVTSLAIPSLGCGNGKLAWQDVRPLIEKHLGNLQIPIEIYLPFKATPRAQKKRARSDDVDHAPKKIAPAHSP